MGNLECSVNGILQGLASSFMLSLGVQIHHREWNIVFLPEQSIMKSSQLNMPIPLPGSYWNTRAVLCCVKRKEKGLNTIFGYIGYNEAPRGNNSTMRAPLALPN